MLGAIIGDIVGSKYEFNNIKTKKFTFISEGCGFTDDTVMTVAVAKALMRSRSEKADFRSILVKEMQEFGKKYPNESYGMSFSQWLVSQKPEPYYSYGNGSAMRVSPCGLMAVELEEALSLAKASAEVTHNHPEGIKGAQAVAGAIFLAKTGKTKEEIASFIKTNFYDLEKTLAEIRPKYYFNETCQETVPQAIQAFLESVNFEDAIRNAISLGGDSDTLAAITGSIAWTFYREEKSPWRGIALRMLTEELREIVEEFEQECIRRGGAYYRVGICSKIPHTSDKSEALAFKLTPPPICVEDNMKLQDKIQKISCRTITKEFCSDKNYIDILWNLKLGVVNYQNYIESLYQCISRNTELLNSASLETCFIYLSILWRMDYGGGGRPNFNYNHRNEIRVARMRIVDLLFEE